MEMKTRFLLNSSLLLLLLASACAPASATETPPTQAIVESLPAVVEATALPAVVVEPSSTPPVVVDAAAQPVATSRGPELHATDPSTVSLASGGLHFVEFFRFT
jgi:hypothetical protein